MFRIKVCGVTRLADIDMLVDAGVDAVGINLVPSSPRCVSLATARQMCERARAVGVTSVIVTMDCKRDELISLVHAVVPDAVQLHGHELPDVLAGELKQLPIIKALSWSGRMEEAELAQTWLDHRPAKFAFLVDAYAPGVGGGTGKVARWDLLWPRPALFSDVPLLLAGGLTPENVSEAIRVTHCTGVDTASGVELSPGVKDEQKVIQFAQAANAS